MTHERLKPKERKELIYAAAFTVCHKVGLSSATREAIAKEAGVTEGLVSHYFNTMKQLRRSVARKAMHDMEPVILSQMLTDANYNHLLTPEHKQVALTHLSG